jgi:2,5-diketo-D-gluconate reductase B
MKHIEIKGEKIPKLGLGTWKLRGKKGLDSVKNALSLGYRHIDTARAYGNEAEVGKAIQESDVEREDIFLTTKIQARNLAYDDFKREFQKSIDELKTDYVDLLLIHWPNESIPLEETLRAMKELKEDGKIRNIGVSNFNIELLEEAKKHAEIFTNQVEYHPFLSQDKLLEYCRKNSIVLTAYSPVARGRVGENETLKNIGEKYGKTPYQISLRWLVQQNRVITIPKAASEDHQEQNMNIFDFELDEEEMEKISNLSRNQRLIETRHSPYWD